MAFLFSCDCDSPADPRLARPRSAHLGEAVAGCCRSGCDMRPRDVCRGVCLTRLEVTLVRRVSTDKQAIAVFLDRIPSSWGSNVRCHAGHRDQNRCYDAFGNQRNVPARIALPAAAKTTAVGLKAARSRRRKVSQSLRSLNLI
jgi:hypothetical protein